MSGTSTMNAAHRTICHLSKVLRFHHRLQRASASRIISTATSMINQTSRSPPLTGPSVPIDLPYGSSIEGLLGSTGNTSDRLADRRDLTLVAQWSVRDTEGLLIVSQWVQTMLESLSLDEKLMLLAGRDRWHTRPIDRVGVPSLKVTDGPNGARGEDRDGVTSTSFPVGAAMGATWDPGLIEAVGRALAHETASKGAQVLLGPTVNIPRIPNAGRNFECFSEDPLLSGLLAAAWISGLQSEGIAACIKHFVCNDQETDRFEIDAVVDERALREIYLEPFRIAIEQAAPWSAMSAYNTINGATASEHPMLDEVLRGEFGFNGLIVSDWGGTYGPGVATSGLDLEMPGPGRWLSAEAVGELIGDGAVTVDHVDRKVERLLSLIEKTQAWDAADVPERSVERPEDRELARRVASESIVLLANDGALPLSSPQRLALIGELAAETPHQGGGSSGVNAHRVVSILDGIRVALDGQTEVMWEPGCSVRRWPPPLPTDAIAEGVFNVDYFALPEPNGEPVRSVRTNRSFLPFHGGVEEGIDFESFSVRVTGRVVADVSGTHELSFAAQGRLRVRLDGTLVIDQWSGAPLESMAASVDLDRGDDVAITIEYSPLPGDRSRWLSFGWATGPAPTIEAAVDAAAQADVAIVVAGLGPGWESEGFDRPDLRLPGKQDDLISAVAAVQPKTVVVLTAGSAVEMPWLSDVAAVVLVWYGGQEVGHAVADVLFGRADPGGRLPVTFPTDSSQHPALSTFPGERGRVHYADGVHVGYRGYDELSLVPLFPFGHGLSYTSFEAQVVDRATASEGVNLTIDLSNTGRRSGTEVVQVYAHDIGGVPRRLVGFAKVDVPAGVSKRVTIEIPRERFGWWDPAEGGGWRLPSDVVVLSVRGSFGELAGVAVPADFSGSS